MESGILILVLNVLGAIFAVIATIIGLTSGDKWRNGRFTAKGYFLVGLALVTALTQVGVQVKQARDKTAIEDRVKAVQKAVTGAYSGWVKVGVYENGTWKEQCLYAKGEPEDIKQRAKQGELFTIGTKSAYFVHIHHDKPGRCGAPQKWFDDTTINVLGRGTIVQVLDVVTYPCSQTRTEVWAEIKPFFDNNARTR